MFMSAIVIYFKFAPFTTVYVEPTFSTLKNVLPEKIRRSEMKDMEFIRWLPVQQTREVIDEVQNVTDEG
jgi:hypothetical protein